MFLLLLLSLFSSSVDALTPKIKWAQNEDTIFMTLLIKCRTETKDVQILSDSFRFSCTSVDGSEYSVEFTLREDVIPSRSSCSSQSNEEFCTLRKSEPHAFDRLIHSKEEQKALSPYLSIDWKRHHPSDDGGDDSDEVVFEYTGSKSIIHLHESNIDTQLANRGRIFVDAFYPWCSRCSQYSKSFHTVSRRLPEASFGWVDLRQSKSLRSRFNVTCESSCKIFVLSQNQPTETIPNDNEMKLETSIRSLLEPPATRLFYPKDLVDIREVSPQGLIVGIFESEDSAYQSFVNEAKIQKFQGSQVRFVVSVGALLDIPNGEYGSVHFYSSSGDRSEFDGRLPEDTTKLSSFANAVTLPLFSDYEWRLTEKIKQMGLPLVYVFHRDEDESTLPIRTLQQLASEHRGKLAFIRITASQQRMKADFGISDETWPAIGIESPPPIKRYVYPSTRPLTPQNIKLFFQGYYSGKLKPSYRSEPVPKQDVAGELNKIVWKTFEGDILHHQRQIDYLVVLYKPYASTWAKVNNSMTKVAKVLSILPHFLVGALDITKNYFAADLLHLDETTLHEPVILFFDRTARLEDIDMFEGPVSQKAIYLWLKQASPNVLEHWDSVKEKIAEMNKIEIENKKLAEDAKKKLSDKQLSLFSGEGVIDITGDGGILKVITEEGEGDVPIAGSKISAHYSGTLLDGTEFDSSWSRNKPFDFELGKRKVIKCWDQAFAHMKSGERALIKCLPAYAYGSSGAPPTIPPEATLIFDVTLVAFIPPKDEL